MRKVHLKRRLCSQKGFTLIELMAVLAILAIILAIAVPSIGKILDKAEESADESAIDLIEHAGELADVDKEPHDTVVAPPGGDEFSVPEKDSYSVPTLVKKGYLKLDKDSKFYAPGEYVTKKNKGGEYVYKGKAGKGSDDGDAPGGDAGEVADNLACEDAVADGYICIETPEELDAMRDDLTARYILMNDIDLSAYSNWISIGNTDAAFNGELNGNGYKITNLTLGEQTVDEAGKGLFGYVEYGTFTNLTLENVALDGVDQPNYGSFLISQVYSDSGSNPDALPLTLTNIKLSGTAENVYEFGPLVSDLYSNQVVVIDNVTTDITTDDSVAIAAGLVYYYAPTEMDSSLSVTDITVNGSIVTSDEVAGVMTTYSNESYNGTVLFDNITVNANVAGMGATSGFMTEIVGYTDTVFTARNISINGDVSNHLDEDGDSYGYTSGFADLISFDESDRVLFENITIAGDVWGQTRSSGFASAVGYWSKGEFTIRNVAITGNITGGNAYFFGYFVSAGGVMNPMVIEDITIDSNMVNDTEGIQELNGTVIGYIEMTDSFNDEAGIGDLVFRNFTVTTDQVYDSASTGFTQRIIDTSTGSGKLVYEGVSINGETVTR